jgi:hypothetical protein
MPTKPNTVAAPPYFRPLGTVFCWLLSLLPIALPAQTFSVTPNPVVTDVDLNTNSNPFEFYGGAIITNDTTATLNLKWERVVNDIPDCWASAILGVSIQALPQVDSLTFDLAPGQEGLLNVHIFTTEFAGGTPYAGQGNVELKITNLNDLSDTLRVHYHLSATGDNSCLTSLSNINESNLQLFPNPTTDYFYLTETPDLQTLIVRDIKGKLLLQTPIVPLQKYDVSSLPSGIYLVQLLNDKQVLVKTVKLLKS